MMNYNSNLRKDQDLLLPNINVSLPIPAKLPTLCLNMIVKNESKIILRLLESVVNLIDAYCICDTGSTDDTADIIRNFFKTHNIPGIIVNEPFRDFGYNRTFALNQCESIDTMDYILLLDADMILTGPCLSDPTAFKQSLQADVYYLFQGSDRFFYKNVRIVRNHMKYTYWGVTHEYVKTPDGTKYDKIGRTRLFINDIGDGGAKSDKFVRDIRLLTKGLEDNPNNDRYTFYLANSYRDARQYESAIETYKKRIKLGGWIEEIWHSYYSIGKCYRELKDMPNAIYYWMEGFNYYPKRIENIYEIMHYYRVEGKHQLAYFFYILAYNERRKNGASPDYLFLQKDVYDYKIDYELSIIGYYVNHAGFDLQKCSMKVLSDSNVDDATCRNVLSNYKFYTHKIKDWAIPNKNLDVLKNIGQIIIDGSNNENEFVTSTPSVCIHENSLYVNVRYVNYRIDENGKYINRDKIATKNIVAKIDLENQNDSDDECEWTKQSEYLLQYDEEKDNVYVGLEDIRLFSDTTQLLYNANRGLNHGNIVVEHGIIDMSNSPVIKTIPNILEIQHQKPVEKNWVLFHGENERTKIVYNWSPLIIGDITDSTKFTQLHIFNVQSVSPYSSPEGGVLNVQMFTETHRIETPTLFKYLRGSTNGVVIDDEIWFIAHTVSYEDRRYYYHIIVVLDKTTYKVKKYTPFFTFEKEKVEYTLGFCYFEKTKQLLIGYSIMDKSTEYILVNKLNFDNIFVVPDKILT